MEDGTRTVLQAVARIVAVGSTFIPALGKFVVYSQQVAEFRMWRIPYPELLVPVVGVTQMLAMATIAAGFAGRYGAAALSVVMVVAIVAVGPTALNVPVVLACLTIMVLGTGPYTRWDPQLPILGELFSLQDTPS